MKKVLVIEDEENVRLNLVDILEAEGFETYAEADGLSGFQRAREMLPDLILCDITMPGLDGYQVLRKLRETTETAAIPFIFLTAKAAKEDILNGLRGGADAYITKPFTIDELLNAIEKCL